MPRYEELNLAEPGAYPVLHCCSYALRVLRAVAGSRAPTPDTFAPLHISVRGLAQDASDHGSSAMAQYAIHRLFPRTLINHSRAGRRLPLWSGDSSQNQRCPSALNT